jgi:enhancer of polycomb-like protein
MPSQTREKAPARVVRQRKLNKSTLQQVLREDEIESAEYDSLQNQYHVETGVERSEENVSVTCYLLWSHDMI